MWKNSEGNIKFLLKSPYYIARYFYQKYTRNKSFKKKYKDLYEGSDAVVLLSDWFKKPFCKISGITNKSKLYAIGNPNSFDSCNILDINDKEKIVLYIARLEFSPKRCDRILKIWKHIEKHTHDWQLIILGDGPDKDFFHNLKEELKLQRVTFTGTVDPRPYYKKASISCITSTYEGFPLALGESLQYNIVPLAFSSFEAIFDIIDNNNTGFIIKPFNITSFSTVLLELINTPSLLQRIQNNIANRENKFDIDMIVDKWEKLFTSLTNNY
jgi:glycosyltransferase involved in cell wall biosynthesis